MLKTIRRKLNFHTKNHIIKLSNKLGDFLYRSKLDKRLGGNFYPPYILERIGISLTEPIRCLTTDKGYESHIKGEIEENKRKMVSESLFYGFYFGNFFHNNFGNESREGKYKEVQIAIEKAGFTYDKTRKIYNDNSRTALSQELLPIYIELRKMGYAHEDIC